MAPEPGKDRKNSQPDAVDRSPAERQEHRPQSESGPWRVSRTPYLREMMESAAVPRVFVTVSRALGKSEMLPQVEVL